LLEKTWKNLLNLRKHEVSVELFRNNLLEKCRTKERDRGSWRRLLHFVVLCWSSFSPDVWRRWFCCELVISFSFCSLLALSLWRLKIRFDSAFFLGFLSTCLNPSWWDYTTSWFSFFLFSIDMYQLLYVEWYKDLFLLFGVDFFVDMSQPWLWDYANIWFSFFLVCVCVNAEEARFSWIESGVNFFMRFLHVILVFLLRELVLRSLNLHFISSLTIYTM